MPAFLQTGTSSSSLIGREASEMSVSPAQNFSKPPPVPEVPTVIFTPGFSPWKFSAAASAKGATVLDPSILMVPDSSPVLALALPPPLSSSSPQAVAALGQRGQEIQLANRESQRFSACKREVFRGADLELSYDHGSRLCHPTPQ